MQTPQKKIRELNDLIKYHDALYYGKNASIISDAEYDNLKRELVALEKKYPNFALRDVTERVGSSSERASSKISHKERILSLENVYSESELQQYIERIKRMLHFESPQTELEFFAEEKIDGLTLVLQYSLKDGRIISAATRGNGIDGEDVLRNVFLIENIPKILPQNTLDKFKNDIDVVEIRGEIYISKESFLLLNESLINSGESGFSTARHAASGALRAFDSTKAAELSFIAHGISSYCVYLNTYSDISDLLHLLGFSIANGRICRSIDEMLAFYYEIESNRDQIIYDIDGVVYKVNSLDFQLKLGSSSTSPRYAIAHKFLAKNAVAQIKNIVVQVGRTGVITPVAEITSVMIGGVKVSYVTLHNFEEISKKDIRIDDYISVERAGDVIPKIIEIFHDKRAESSCAFELPLFCPSCESGLVKNGVHYYCYNVDCKAQKLLAIEHFASRDAFNIIGLGEKNIAFLFDHQILQNCVDIFKLPQSTEKCRFLESQQGWGMISVKNLLTQIESAKKISLDKFIYAIGIPQIGKTTAKIIAKQCVSIDNFFKLVDQSDALREIHGIGSSILVELQNFLRERSLKLKELLDFVNIFDYEDDFDLKKQTIFYGKKIAITGVFEKISRTVMRGEIESIGGIIVSSVSKKTDYLIAGKNPGSKIKIAEEFDVSIFSEEQLIELLGF